MLIKVWVCPTEGCGNYYASSSQEHLDLSKELRQGRVEDRDRAGKRLVKGVRADCPDCKAERVPVTIELSEDRFKITQGAEKPNVLTGALTA